MIAAIYSRKSVYSEKGDSIENQIQLCKEYGKNLNVKEYIVYEDEGFSGGNIDRPQFQKMLKDAKAKKFNVLICYRLDRISRNIADFSTLIEELQKLNIAFVSIKEQFDTSTPMGRAMMYIASVFAQLERETIAERVKDNMLELAKTGRWLGGVKPLGFEVVKVKEKEKTVSYLSPIEEQIEFIKMLYEKYAEHKSLYKVLKYLYENNLGKEYRKWDVTRISLLLRAPYFVISDNTFKEYCEKLGITVVGEMNGNGLVPYNQKSGSNKWRDKSEWIFAIGKHKGIIPSSQWIEAYDLIEKRTIFKGDGKSEKSFLTGLIKCGICGSHMIIKYGPKNKDGSRLLYYVCHKKNNGYAKCPGKYFKKEIIDTKVTDYLSNISNDKDFFNESMVKSKNKIQDNSLEIKKYKTQITKNDKSIQNLVKQLAVLTPEASTYIIAEVERLSKENLNMKNKLNELKSLREDTELEQIDKEVFYSKIINFSKMFKKCKTHEQKRALMFSLIAKITVYDEDIKIELLK